MTKLLYCVLLAAIVWKAHADQNDEDRDLTPVRTENYPQIICGENYAQYPNPEDCESYIQCYGGWKYINFCPYGLHYNFRTHKCERPCNAYCDKSLSCDCNWPTCGLDDVCFLEPIVGGCRNRFQRYYFDKRRGQCQEFGYSGCWGNENNFRTLEECQQRCTREEPKPKFACLRENWSFPNPDDCTTYFRCSYWEPELVECGPGLHFSDKDQACLTPCEAYCDKTLSCQCKWPTCGLDDRCFLPYEIGPCRAGIPRYYYNRRDGKCEMFLYGGCRGNENNFAKLEDCEKSCPKKNPKPKFTCLAKDWNFPNPDDCESYFKCSNWEPELVKCGPGLHFSDKDQACLKTCEAFCNKSLACECKWPTCGLDDRCFLPAETGPCRAGFQNYYFNRRTGQCETFLYGGCNGNKNNFQNQEECEKECPTKTPKPKFDCLRENWSFPNPDNCTTYFKCSNWKPELVECDPGSHFSDKDQACVIPCEAYCDKALSCECKWPTCGLDDRCFLPAKTGNCRAGFKNYYFNRRTGQCETFTYGGFDANENNFQKQEDCEKACPTTTPKPKVDCLSENGSFPNPDNCTTYFKCSNWKPELVECDPGAHFSDKDQACVIPCEAYCDKALSCECKWPTCGLDDRCFLPAKTGDCRAIIKNYYFNRRTGQCETFTYGGCDANENNFPKQEDCEKACPKSGQPPHESAVETEKNHLLNFLIEKL